MIGSFGTDSISEISGTSNKDQGKVGDVIHSMLTEEQFIAENGAGWVLADGRDVTGSKYDTLILGGLGGNIPDMRGQFLRGKNNTRSDGQENPDGDVAVGTQTGDGIRNITGTFNNRSDDSGLFEAASGAFAVEIQTIRTDASNVSGVGYKQVRLDASTQVPTAGDNRPKNVTVNIFIKIEDIN